MIREHKIYEDNGKGVYTMFRSDDFEYVDPIKHFSESFIQTNVSMIRDFFFLKKPPIPPYYIESFIHKEVIKEWTQKLKEIENTQIPENLILLLESNSKSQQEKLLKESTITPDQLIAFIFKAWKDYGLSYSQYTSEHNHKGLDKTKMPKLVEIKDGKVNKVGDTPLTDGQLKQAVEHRKVIISKFLDKEKTWHCLFLTFDSIKGKESWKGGKPHYHYISDKFGIQRDKVVEQLKSNNYNLNSLPHIELINYRDDE